MSDDPYVYAGTNVLRNKLGIRDQEQLNRVERRLTTQRATERLPAGAFDLSHLKAIHFHLFQDLYEWAGQFRTVEINKGATQFQFRQYIETGMDDVHRRIVGADHFQNRSPAEFAIEVGVIMGDVNYVHPFREGNGRTQLIFLQQLGAKAGHQINLRKIDKARWLEASKRSINGDYVAMGEVIKQAIGPSRTRGQSRRRRRD